MGKLKNYDIVFDWNREVYNIGDIVAGHVAIELSDSLQCRGVRVRFRGMGRVHWTESEGSGDNRKTVHYSAESVFFDETVTVWGKEKGESGDNPTLHAGTHQFPFRFQLPTSGLPYSFEGTAYGYVRYTVKSNIDRPWKFDHNTKRAFTVTGIPVDLNRYPDSMFAQQDEDQKTVCCLCCATGPITMTATTDRKGYVSGEIISVGMDVDNVSSRDINDSEAALVQKCKFTAFRHGHGWRHTRTTKEKVSIIKGMGCGPNDKISWRGQPLPIPPIPASGLEGFEFIDIEYCVKFEADISNTPFDLDVSIPVTIGTIPLQQVYSNFTIPLQPFPDPTAPPLPPPDSGANLPPPPSYAALYSGEKSIKDDEDNDYLFGQSDFAPKYTYYNFGSMDQTQSQNTI
ncbi:arrestin domain-containing protein 3-like [Glandiceps talaboti]